MPEAHGKDAHLSLNQFASSNKNMVVLQVAHDPMVHDMLMEEDFHCSLLTCALEIVAYISMDHESFPWATLTADREPYYVSLWHAIRYCGMLHFHGQCMLSQKACTVTSLRLLGGRLNRMQNAGGCSCRLRFSDGCQCAHAPSWWVCNAGMTQIENEVETPTARAVRPLALLLQLLQSVHRCFEDCFSADGSYSLPIKLHEHLASVTKDILDVKAMMNGSMLYEISVSGKSMGHMPYPCPLDRSSQGAGQVLTH